MTHILVTYATLSGSTQEVARTVQEVLSNAGCSVDVLPVDEVDELQHYDAIVAGAPMILGWHRQAQSFLRTNRKTWAETPLAVFVTAMSLTNTSTDSVSGIPIFMDEKLPKKPARAERLSLRERYSTVQNYIRPILRAVSPAQPVSVAFFGGQLIYGRLPWWAVLVALVLVRDQVGDKRDWEAIRSWASELPARFGLSA